MMLTHDHMSPKLAELYQDSDLSSSSDISSEDFSGSDALFDSDDDESYNSLDSEDRACEQHASISNC